MTRAKNSSLTVARNGIDLARIAPEVHSRYSPNLHAFLSMPHNGPLARFGRVYRDDKGALWVGFIFDGDFTGARMTHVLAWGGTRTVSTFLGLAAELKEVEGFWERYIATGRCAIDEKHEEVMAGDEFRWSTSGDSRTCRWCGSHTQVMKRWTEEVPRATWVSAA